MEKVAGRFSWKNIANLHSATLIFVLNGTYFRIMLARNLSISEMKLQ